MRTRGIRNQVVTVAFCVALYVLVAYWTCADESARRRPRPRRAGRSGYASAGADTYVCEIAEPLGLAFERTIAKGQGRVALVRAGAGFVLVRVDTRARLNLRALRRFEPALSLYHWN